MKKILPLLLVCTLFSCRKDLRSKTYTLRGYNHSGATGTVKFLETSDKNFTTVYLEAHGLRLDTLYRGHLHTGVPGNLTGTLLYFDALRTHTGSLTYTINWNETYDNAINSNTCVTLHNPDFFSNDTVGYALAGGTGKNE
ncbi:MAG: hypothetical protein U0T73_06530 [Chitinophagales bacterium]